MPDTTPTSASSGRPSPLALTLTGDASSKPRGFGGLSGSATRESPILFSAPMVRALLAGTKTQTRRVVKADVPPGAKRVIRPFADERLQWAATDPHDMEQGQLLLGEVPRCPYGQPGDRLWVRETFAIVPRTAYRCSEGVQQTLKPDDDHDAAIYRAGWDRSNGGLRWRPAIHMPRWASRILLEVTDVRVERLQDISIADAMAEGVAEASTHLRGLEPCMEWRYAYEDLWESINGPGSWDANPWVWVLSFRRTDGGGNG